MTKRIKAYGLCSLLLLMLIFASGMKSLSLPSPENTIRPEMCTSLLVGKEATIDGSVICTQSADGGNCDARLWLIPAGDHPSGSKRVVKGWDVYDRLGLKGSPSVRSGPTFEIPQVSRTFAGMGASFPFMNERQVAVGEATIIGVRSALAPSKNSEAKVTITDLSRVALERAATAREAIRIMASIMEEHGFNAWTPSWGGYGSPEFNAFGEYFAVADRNEVWAFEFLPVGPGWKKSSGEPGVVWCAMRIPDDEFAVMANESIIGEINPGDAENFMASKNVKLVAARHGWWDPKSGKPFRWDEAYSGKRAKSLRTWRALSLVAPSRNLKPNQDGYPNPIKPDKKLSILDIRRIHADRFEGTEFDQTKGLAAGPYGSPNWPRGTPNMTRSIGTMGSESIIINQCREWLPDIIGGVMWVALGGGDITLYVPFYAGITRLPEPYSEGVRTKFSWDSAFWVYNLVGSWAQLNYLSMIKEINRAQSQVENAELMRQAFVDEEASKLYQKDPSAAGDFLTDYCVDNALKALATWKELAAYLIARYSYGTITAPYEAPEWWKKAVEKYQK